MLGLFVPMIHQAQKNAKISSPSKFPTQRLFSREYEDLLLPHCFYRLFQVINLKD